MIAHASSTVGGAIDDWVVDNDELVICIQLHIQFQRLCPLIKRPIASNNCVFMRTTESVPVRNHGAAACAKGKQ